MTTAAQSLRRKRQKCQPRTQPTIREVCLMAAPVSAKSAATVHQGGRTYHVSRIDRVQEIAYVHLSSLDSH